MPSNSWVLHPYVLSTSNRRRAADNLRAVYIPDVSPSEVLDEPLMSMTAGEFLEVYGSPAHVGYWDAVLTCFFLDTAKNVVQYIRTIADLVKVGGLWANLGPLLFHYADTPNEMSIELAWDEIKPVIEKWFKFENIEWTTAYYTTNFDSMMQIQYNCVNFVAIRNDVAATGVSNPVYV
eukprot:GHVT01066403.1.p1 GENE.GHVT01066403.1~~GHVT01066403.1.p1  ORF type:complete len:178 (-),score=28.52 GHVT01066403.1:667-1200(-)